MTSSSPSRSPAADRIDSIAVTLDRRGDPIRRGLDELLTRSFYSGAGYVFECDPFAQPEDGDVFTALAAIREGDRRHAHVLGSLIEARGGVPSTGVFPWWNLDLNYLTVPCLSRFVLESLREEVAKYDALVAAYPTGTPHDAEARASLMVIRAEKSKQVADFEPIVVAAEKREADDHKSKMAAVKKAREARIAKAKAAAEAAKKAKQAASAAAATPAAKAPAAGAAPAAAKAVTVADPNEPGISRRERGRRLVLQMRAKAGRPLSLLPSAPAAGAAPDAAPAAAAAAPAAAPAGGGALLDPNEPGIAPKEKARRQMLKMRAASGAPAPAASAPAAAPAPAAAAAPAPAPAAAAPSLAGAELLDPNEPGISPKEKARRQIAKNRAAGGGPAPSPAPAVAAPAAAPAPAPVPEPAAAAPAALPADLGDPSEPGITPKEKARRTMARMRAQKG